MSLDRDRQGQDKPSPRVSGAGRGVGASAAGRALAHMIRIVSATSSTVTDPPDLVDRVEALHPTILAVWHGQFMMLSHLKRDHLRYAAMVAKHGDADLIGGAMAAFGLDIIRGAGAGERKKDRGGAQALRGAVQALQGTDGKPPAAVVMTADVPPGPARRAGEGIIMLARLSGRPIQPIAVASSRYRALRTWSRMTINLPFSKLVFVAAEPVYVPRECSPQQLEQLRQELEDKLNDATIRAYALAGADPSRATPPNPRSRPRAPGMLNRAYLGVMSAAKPLTGRLLEHRSRQGKEDPHRIGERSGIANRPRPAGRLVWVHAASVGETNAVLPLIRELRLARPDAQVLLTTTTVTSAKIAAERLPPGAFHQFVPLDVPAYTQAFLDHWRPDLAVFTESEVWPSLIMETHARDIPLALVNGRLSPRSYKRWMRLVGFAEPLFGRFDVILAQNEKIGRWFRDVGARRVIPAGNLKADAPPSPVDPVRLETLSAMLAGRRPLLAASTHPGEEAIIATAHRLIASSDPGHVTIIVPRHPERGVDIAREIDGETAGFTVALRSRGEAIPANGGIYIADTLGELGLFYATCPVVLMGGSLVRHGGQNPLEAIPFGAALLTGRHTHNFKTEYQALGQAGAVIEVNSPDEIAAATIRVLAEADLAAQMAERASTTLAGLRGALDKTLAIVLPMLPPPVRDGAAGAVREASDAGGAAERLTTAQMSSLERAG